MNYCPKKNSFYILVYTYKREQLKKKYSSVYRVDGNSAKKWLDVFEAKADLLYLFFTLTAVSRLRAEIHIIYGYDPGRTTLNGGSKHQL